MRNLKYFWIKRFNILWGFLAIWLSGKLALHTNGEMLDTWSNPGSLSFPIGISFVFFFGGLIALIYVFLRCDIDEVLPQKQ